MSGKSNSRTGRQILEWLRDRGLLLVTLTGVLLYFFLSVPAAIFYARFGVSAAEVGISYASLLSGSTVEIFLGVTILAGALVVAAYLIVLLTGITFLFFIYMPYMFLHVGFSMFRSINELNNQQFERFLAAHLHIIGRFRWLMWAFAPEDHSMAGIEREIRSARDLRKQRRELRAKLRKLPTQAATTADASAQLALIDSQIHKSGIRDALMSNYHVIKAAIQHWGWVLMIGFVSVTVVVLLPVLAIVQSDEVRDGNSYFGSSTGAFDYHADLVEVTPSSDHPAPSIQALRGEKLLLLGENAQYAVLYLPSRYSTIRVPISSVVISSVG